MKYSFYSFFILNFMFHVSCIEINCLCVGGIGNNKMGKTHFYRLYILHLWWIVFNQAQLTHYGSKLKHGVLGEPIHSDTWPQLINLTQLGFPSVALPSQLVKSLFKIFWYSLAFFFWQFPLNINLFSKHTINFVELFWSETDVKLLPSPLVNIFAYQNNLSGISHTHS